MGFSEKASGWWAARQDYSWFSGFLERQMLTGLLKWAIAGWCFTLGVYGLALESSENGPTTPFPRAVILVFSVSAFYAAATLIVVAMITFIPLLLHVIVHFLKRHADDSSVDPLTGLLNRRGFVDNAGRNDSVEIDCAACQSSDR